MSLPVFIICVLSLAMIIRIIASIDAIVFEQSIMLHKMQMKAPELFPTASGENYRVKDFDYLFTDKGIEDLISLDSEENFRVENPIGVNGRIEVDMRIMLRGFTGAEQYSQTLTEEDFHEGGSCIVVVFPKYGKRFHSKECRYSIKSYSGDEVKLEMQKRDAELKGYTPCLVCNGG